MTEGGTAVDGARLDETLRDQIGEAPERTFTCPECGDTFNTAQGLGAHRNKRHGIRSSTKRRPARRPKPEPAPRAFDTRAALRLVAPDGSVRAADFERVAAWLDEGRRIWAR